MDTFYSKYSSWYLPLNDRQKQQYERLERLVFSFNANLKQEVIRSKDKYNLKVRGVIAEKTGVSLTYRTNEVENRNNSFKEIASVPIKIIDRVPISLLNLFDNFDDKHIELLLHYRRMRSTVIELEFQLSNYNHFVHFHKKISDPKQLENTISHLNSLIKEVEDSKILNSIRRLGPDLLGAYFLRDNRIEIYWLCIGFCGIIYDLPIEDFTIIILIHELVHGYTHLGFDKDGHNWKTDDFGTAHLNIIEGFAQLYTEMLCKDFFDQSTKAFYALLPEQNSEYTEFRNWFQQDEKDKYEKARRILLRTRTKRIVKYEDFIEKLEEVRKDF